MVSPLPSSLPSLPLHPSPLPLSPPSLPSRFPLDFTSVLHFLEPLAMTEPSAREVFQLLHHQIKHYTDDFTHISPHRVDVGREAGSWVITQPLPLYPRGEVLLPFLPPHPSWYCVQSLDIPTSLCLSCPWAQRVWFCSPGMRWTPSRLLAGTCVILPGTCLAW